MPNYLRVFEPGGTFFFTVVTYGRRPIFKSAQARAYLGEAMREVRQAAFFEMPGFVILPDHFHCLWSLPTGDTAYSSRWSRIKRLFSKSWTSAGMARSVSSSRSRIRHRELDVWQRRFWEHTIRDEADFINHLEYIHFNPVKHELVSCPHAWPHSSFHRWVRSGEYPENWQCVCEGRSRRKMAEVVTAGE